MSRCAGSMRITMMGIVPRVRCSQVIPDSEHVVTHYLRQQELAGDWAERANRMVERLGARDLALRHYSEQRLKSPEARAAWIEPDIRPLP